VNLLLKLTDGQFENVKIKVQNAKLWNPDRVGMAVLIIVLFSIILYHIMVYIGSWLQIGQFELLFTIGGGGIDLLFSIYD